MKPAVLIVCVFVAAATARAADDSLGKAKDLYAAAAYEDALTMLQDLATAAHSGESPEVDEYRAFCLYALGRSAEADAIVASLMRREPAFHIEGADASPRVEAAFAAVRKRVLPDLIRDQYRSARDSFDHRATAKAEAQLLEAKQMLDEARAAGTWDTTLSDLQVLIDGFLDLNGAAAPKQPASQTSEQPTPAQNTAAQPAAPTAAAAALATTAGGEYTAADQDVAPPVAIRHDVPPVPENLLPFVARRRGLLELHIDANGAVQRVVLHGSLTPVYDQLLKDVARTWQYHPAVKGGVPVAYMEFITLDVSQ